MNKGRTVSAVSLSLACCFASLGCVEDEIGAPTEELASDNEALSGGTVPSTGAPDNSAVRYVWANGFYCSGAKIGARRFITASHCLLSSSAGKVGDPIRITNSLDGSVSSITPTTVTAINFHPSVLNWNTLPTPTSTDYTRAFDVAVITVAGDTPSIPALDVRWDYVAPGTYGRVLGYGCDKIGNRSNLKSVGIFRAGSLADLQARYGNTEGALGLFTYNIPLVSTSPNLCPGDSGGPMFVQNQFGTWEVAGINSTSNTTDFGTLARTHTVALFSQGPLVNRILPGEAGFLLNGKSDLCMGIDGASNASNASAGQYYCDQRHSFVDNQVFSLIANGTGTGGGFRIKDAKSQLCLGVDGASVSSGARIAQYPCGAPNGNLDSQAFFFEAHSTGRVRIRNGKSNLCMGVGGGSLNREAYIFQYPCNNFDPSQGWTFVR